MGGPTVYGNNKSATMGDVNELGGTSMDTHRVIREDRQGHMGEGGKCVSFMNDPLTKILDFAPL